jgi:hypothetical protein
VPAGTKSVPFTGVTIKVIPLQTSAVLFAIIGSGLRVTVNVKEDPEHPPAVGVTVYVAVATALVVLVSVPVIDAPLPAAPPKKFAPAGAPQL